VDTHAALQRRAAGLGLRRGSARDPAFRSRSVRHVRRGVFCIDPTRAPTFEENVVAALLVLPAGSVAAGYTAARLWRFDGLTASNRPLELLVPAVAGSVRQAGSDLRFETFTGVELPDGIPATSQPRTLVDLTARLTFADGVVLIESALRRDPTLRTALTQELAHRRPRRGATRVRDVVAFADVLSESVLESRARVLWREAALPPPRQQATIRHDGRFVARVDFLWERGRLIVEVDGLAKYEDPRALRDEKRRQNELVALGYTVLRFTWADVVGRPDYVVAQVRLMINKE
jgi:hypothetical protein